MTSTGITAIVVLVAKFLDHLPLYRQEHIFERAGLAIARSTLAQWVGECGAQCAVNAQQAEAQYARQQAMLAKEEAFIARFKARASHAAQVQSRVKKLDKIEKVEPPRRRRVVQFDFLSTVKA